MGFRDIIDIVVCSVLLNVAVEKMVRKRFMHVAIFFVFN